MTFGERLTILRKEKGFATRNEFAEKLGIPSTTLRNYETDVREPGHSFLVQMSDFFNVSTDYLLGLTNERDRVSPYTLKTSEIEHIKKYRSLDPYGQETVSLILDREVTRSLQLKEEVRTTVVEADVLRPNAPLHIYTYLRKIASAGNGFYFDDIPTETIEVPFKEGADFIIGVNGDSMEPTYSDGELVYVHRQQIVNIGDIGIFIKNGECLIKEAGADGLISHNTEMYPLIPGTDDIICIGKVLGKVV